MTTWHGSRRRSVRILILLLVSTGAGCAQVLEAGLTAVAHDLDGAVGAPGSSAVGPPTNPPPSGVASVYQSAPTHDWVSSQVGGLATPGHSLFQRMSPTRVSCHAVPVGLARVYSGPSGPSASRLVRLGPIEAGVAGPDGAFADIFATSRAAVSTRALRSGARMAGRGPYCGHGFSLYISIGGTSDPVLLNR